MTPEIEALAEAARGVAAMRNDGDNIWTKISRLQKALAAFDAAPANAGWRPIETAPKDGTLILAWNKSLGRHIVYWGCQPQHNPHYFWVSATCNTSHIDQPEKWCHLPPPPTDRESEG